MKLLLNTKKLEINMITLPLLKMRKRGLFVENVKMRLFVEMRRLLVDNEAAAPRLDEAAFH